MLSTEISFNLIFYFIGLISLVALFSNKFTIKFYQRQHCHYVVKREPNPFWALISSFSSSKLFTKTLNSQCPYFIFIQMKTSHIKLTNCRRNVWNMKILIFHYVLAWILEVSFSSWLLQCDVKKSTFCSQNLMIFKYFLTFSFIHYFH